MKFLNLIYNAEIRINIIANQNKIYDKNYNCKR